MKKLLALVVALVVLVSGCLCLGGDNNKDDRQTNCTWTLPHAKIVYLTNMEYPSDMVRMELADFSTFQELANGTVYAVDVYSSFGARPMGLDLVYFHNDTVYTYYLSLVKCGSHIIIKNNTIKVLEG